MASNYDTNVKGNTKYGSPCLPLAAKRYYCSIQYKVPTYGSVNIIGILGNWARITWYIQPKDKLFYGWIQLRTAQGISFWIRGDPVD